MSGPVLAHLDLSRYHVPPPAMTVCENDIQYVSHKPLEILGKYLRHVVALFGLPSSHASLKPQTALQRFWCQHVSRDYSFSHMCRRQP
jgi:hypothetical protein